MGRLCERPGCSENAAVAYGMRTEDLVFWLDVLREPTPVTGGVLCQRHGDSMVVPRGWTLDDLRDPELHLFRPPPRADGAGRPTRRRSASGIGHDDAEQLDFDELPAHDVAHAPHSDPPVEERETTAHSTGDPRTGAATEPVVASGDTGGAAADSAEPWTPVYDAADDLGGLLSARSPLLSRAFRGTDRPD